MTIPFYTLNIHEPLQQMLNTADDAGEWQPVLDYCEPFIETTTDDGVILCYTFALLQQAVSIHVDDVAETCDTCLTLLKRLQHTYGGTDHFKRMIKRVQRAAKQIHQKENNLLLKDYTTLSASDKSKLAYNLTSKGGVENCKRAAEIHFDLIELNKDTHDMEFHHGQYIVNLYKSNQLALANEKFDEFLEWMKHTTRQSYNFLIDICFEQKIVRYLDDYKIFGKPLQHILQ
jgi:hypothetical protein